MKPLLWPLVLLLAISMGLIQNVRAASATASPAEVTQALYQSCLTHFTGFTKESLSLDQKWLTPELYTRLLKKLNKPVPKDEAPDIEGDVFLDCQEPPTKFEIGKSSIDQMKAKVEVTLIWPNEKRHYTVLLEQIKGTWKVSDVNYGKDGNLTDLL